MGMVKSSPTKPNPEEDEHDGAQGGDVRHDYADEQIDRRHDRPEQQRQDHRHDGEGQGEDVRHVVFESGAHVNKL
jgi:hypothetical protein